MNFDHGLELITSNLATGVITLDGTGAVQLPAGTNAQRPANAAGLFRWNTQATGIEANDGSVWRSLQFSATTLAGYGITDAQPLAAILTSISGLATAGLIVRTGAGTTAARTIQGTAGNVTVNNGDGVAGDPTINLATVGTAGTYASVTTDAFGRVTAGSTTQSIATGGTGLSALGTANQVLGVNAGATGLEYKTLVAGTNVTITQGVGTVTIASTGGSGTPGGVNTNVQFNNSGAFGGSSAFNFVTGTNPYVSIAGTALTNQLRIGGATDINNATFYVENVGDATSEACRIYFRRSTPGINGWISWDYDQNTPNVRITDEDDDPPYIQFNTIGTGTYASPLYTSVFGARGGYASRTAGNNAGFAWHIGANTTAVALITANTPAMELDSQWLRVPSGTTAQRPGTTANGMIRYNTTTNSLEGWESGAVWTGYTGIIDRNFVNVTSTATGTTTLVSYSVPGGTLGTASALRVRLGGQWANGGGTGNRTVQFTFNYGGTNMVVTTTTGNWTTANGTTAWEIDVMLSANNSVTAQQLTGKINIGAAGGSTGQGNLASTGTTVPATNAPIFGTAAVNSAVAQTLTISVTTSFASASTFTKAYHIIEKL